MKKIIAKMLESPGLIKGQACLGFFCFVSAGFVGKQHSFSI